MFFQFYFACALQWLCSCGRIPVRTRIFFGFDRERACKLCLFSSFVLTSYGPADASSRTGMRHASPFNAGTTTWLQGLQIMSRWNWRALYGWSLSTEANAEGNRMQIKAMLCGSFSCHAAQRFCWTNDWRELLRSRKFRAELLATDHCQVALSRCAMEQTWTNVCSHGR